MMTEDLVYLIISKPYLIVFSGIARLQGDSNLSGQILKLEQPIFSLVTSGSYYHMEQWEKWKGGRIPPMVF